MPERLLAGQFRESTFFETHTRFDEWHQREEISFQTPDLENVIDAKNRGWTFKRTKEGFIVRAPEQWLVDLTDPYKVSACGDTVCNFAYYSFLKGLIDQGNFDDYMKTVAQKNGMQGLIIKNLQGPSLETEIRVAGSDKRIGDFRRLAYWEARQSRTWPEIYDHAQEQLGTTHPVNFEKKSLFEDSQPLAQFYAYIKERFSMLDNTRTDVFNPEFIPDLFKDVPDADVYLFIPWGSLRYVPSFINQENMSKIMFWEIHYDGCQEHTNRFMAKELKNKSVLIIDNSYSGGTLAKMKDAVEAEGGYPSRLALFPKSRMSIQGSEYALVLDRIVESNQIDINNPNWATDIYKTVLTPAQPQD